MCPIHFNKLPLLSATYSTTTLKSNQTDKTFKNYQRVNCKSSFVIYPLECYICNIQYVAIPPWKHFNRHDHDFNNHGKIIIIEQLRNILAASTETLKERQKQQENFWIIKLETLASLGLNQDLNWIHFMQTFRSPPLFFVSAYGLKQLT